MKAEDLQQIKHLLEQERRELLTEVDRLNETGLNRSQGESIGELSTYDNHPADLGSETFERSKDSALVDNALVLLDRIDAALDKLEQGNYGVCEGCGKPISIARLTAVPYAARCLVCQQHVEQDDTTPRPLEEASLTPPFVRTFTDEQDQTGFDGEDALQAVLRYGSSDTPQDLAGVESFSTFFPDGNEQSGEVELVDGIAALGPLGTGNHPKHFKNKKK
jgi:YteA family regulatory protein